MVDKRYDKKIYELVDLVKKNGYSIDLYHRIFINCLDEDTQAKGFSDDFLDKAIELGKKGLSGHDYEVEFTKYVFSRYGIEWK